VRVLVWLCADDKGDVLVTQAATDIRVLHGGLAAGTRGVDAHTVTFPETPSTFANVSVEDHRSAAIGPTNIGTVHVAHNTGVQWRASG